MKKGEKQIQSICRAALVFSLTLQFRHPDAASLLHLQALEYTGPILEKSGPINCDKIQET